MKDSNLEAYLSSYEYTQTSKKNSFRSCISGKRIQKAVEEYDLPSIHTVHMWIRQFQKQLESSMIVCRL